MRHSRPPKQRLWLGPGRYICGCERRITHANAYSYSDCYSHGDSDTHSNSYGDGNSNRDAHSNRNRYIDAKRESYSYSYWHSHTETYTYSKSSPVRSASPHTAAETVAIFTRRSFFALGDR